MITGSLKLSFRHINTFDTNEDVKLSDRIFSSRKLYEALSQEA